MERNYKARNWCFTLNNYTFAEENAIKRIECKWMVLGREFSSGTPRLEGAISFENPRYFKAMKTLIPRAHIEKVMGPDFV